MSKYISLLAALLLAVALCLGDESTAPEKPKSRLAVAALARYEHAKELADAAYKKAMIAAERKLIEDLKPALIAATKAGSLDEANAIQSQVKAAQARLEYLAKPTSENPIFRIDAASEWQSTIDLVQGHNYRILAKGTWCCNVNDRAHGTFGPEGDHRWAWGYLQGRVANGTPFKIGASLTLTAKTDGPLEMQMFDTDGRGNKDGHMSVSVVDVAEK